MFKQYNQESRIDEQALDEFLQYFVSSFKINLFGLDIIITP